MFFKQRISKKNLLNLNRALVLQIIATNCGNFFISQKKKKGGNFFINDT